MSKAMVVTTQRTAKKYKAGVLVAWGLLTTGIVAAAAGAASFGATAVGLSVVTWSTSKVLAWWNHG